MQHPSEKIAALLAENAALKQQNTALLAENAALRHTYESDDGMTAAE